MNMNIRCQKVGLYRNRDMYQLIGTKEELSKAQKELPKTDTACINSKDGKWSETIVPGKFGDGVKTALMISAPASLAIKGSIVNLTFSKELNRYFPDGTDMRDTSLHLQRVGESNLDEFSKQQIAGDTLSSSNFIRSVHQQPAFTQPPAQTEPEVDAKNANLEE